MDGFYLNDRIMQLTVEEEHRQAEARRQQKEIGKIQTGWLSRQWRQALSRVACFIISTSQKLLPSVQSSAGC